MRYFIVKVIDSNTSNIKKPYFFITEDNYFKEKKFLVVDYKKTILLENKKFYIVKGITFSDYAIISYVMENFFDDENYCYLILHQYFEMKAKKICWY
ncbi:MAG: hypothetical protein LBD05_02835 [Mycoplasmataceae bacterium]|jgi:hypothetical protein|nr:hypothetical protein [Mycoplasmataceae bacterium]